jgi:hypothetical protein
MKLPKAEQNLEEWQTAGEILIKAAEGRDFLMHARIAMMRAGSHRNALGKTKIAERSISGIKQVGGSSQRQCMRRGRGARSARWA